MSSSSENSEWSGSSDSELSGDFIDDSGTELEMTESSSSEEEERPRKRRARKELPPPKQAKKRRLLAAERASQKTMSSSSSDSSDSELSGDFIGDSGTELETPRKRRAQKDLPPPKQAKRRRRNLCLSKKVLSLFASLYETSVQDLYLRYLDKGCDQTLPFKNIAGGVKNSLDYFDSCFRSEKPETAPKFFSVTERVDCSKLGKSLLLPGDSLVVLVHTAYKKRLDRYHAVYDSRTHDVLVLGKSIDPDRTRIVVLNFASQTAFLHTPHCKLGLDNDSGQLKKQPGLTHPGTEHRRLYQTPLKPLGLWGFGRSENTLDALLKGRVGGLQGWTAALLRRQCDTLSEALARSLPELEELLHAVESASDLIAVHKDVAALRKRPLLLVAHRNTIKKRYSGDMDEVAANEFLYLGLFGGEKDIDIWNNMDSLDCCLITPTYLATPRKRQVLFECALLGGAWRERAWTGYTFSSRRSDSSKDSHLPASLLARVHEASAGKREAARVKRAETKKRLERKRKAICARIDGIPLFGSSETESSESEQEQPVRKEWKPWRELSYRERSERAAERHPCSCQSCVKAFESYAGSVRPTGPQRRVSCEPSSYDYLKMFGWDDEATKKALRLVCDLSVCAMDIEATTETVEEESCMVYEPVGRIRPPGAKVATQRACLIGHADNFVEGESMVYKVFELNSENDDAALVGEWYAHMRKRRLVLAARKRSLLASVFAKLDAISDAVRKYYGENADRLFQARTELEWKKKKRRARAGERDDESDGSEEEGDAEEFAAREAEDFIRNSLPGKFKLHLLRLCEEMKVFTFAGAGYDHVLVADVLAVAYRTLHKSSCRFSVMKMGSRVRRIVLGKDFIAVHDVKELLAASASLDSFSRLADLPITKLYFPFALLSSRKFLEAKGFPSDPSKWHDMLSQRRPSQKEVDEVIGKFEAGGFANVGEFLKNYLRTDVALTGQATCKFLNTVLDEIGSHPIDVRKMTMASFAFNAVQLDLFRGVKPAFYSPDCKPIFKIISDSSIGGLTFVGRHKCAPGTEPLNSHRLPDNEITGDTVVYLDETSLYGSSG